MVRPTTRSPRLFNMPATTELSTPPDIATAVVRSADIGSEVMGSGTGVGRRQLAKLGGGLGHRADQRIHLLFIIGTAERESQAAARLAARQANREQNVRGLDGSARTGRTARYGESFQIERDDHGLT